MGAELISQPGCGASVLWLESGSCQEVGLRNMEDFGARVAAGIHTPFLESQGAVVRPGQGSEFGAENCSLSFRDVKELDVRGDQLSHVAKLAWFLLHIAHYGKRK